jgi:hypothetical protein
MLKEAGFYRLFASNLIEIGHDFVKERGIPKGILGKHVLRVQGG